MRTHDSYALYLKHKALKRWKVQAMRILRRIDDITETVPSALGSELARLQELEKQPVIDWRAGHTPLSDLQEATEKVLRGNK